MVEVYTERGRIILLDGHEREGGFPRAFELVCGAALRGSELQIDERLRKGRVSYCRGAFDAFELTGAVEDKMGV